MPKEDFISLGRLGNWLHLRKYNEHAVFELLCKGELKAVIHHPLMPLRPFPIPSSEWLKLDHADFRIQQLNRNGQRTGKAFYIEDSFAYDIIISQIRELLNLTHADRQTLLGYPELDLYLDAEICRNQPDVACWETVRRRLVDRLIEIYQQHLDRVAKSGESRSRVFVFKTEFEEFTKLHRIEEEKQGKPSTAGRKRIAKKDNVWVEILERFYVVQKTSVTPKVRAGEIQQYARDKLNYPISLASVENLLRAIDEIATDAPG